MGFKDNLAADMDVFFSDFADDITWNGTTFKGQLFNRSEVVLDGYAGVEDERIYVIAPSSMVDGITHGDAVSVNAETFEVTDVKYDRADIVKIYLSVSRDRPFN